MCFGEKKSSLWLSCLNIIKMPKRRVSRAKGGMVKRQTHFMKCAGTEKLDTLDADSELVLDDIAEEFSPDGKGVVAICAELSLDILLFIIRVRRSTSVEDGGGGGGGCQC